MVGVTLGCGAATEAERVAFYREGIDAVFAVAERKAASQTVAANEASPPVTSEQGRGEPTVGTTLPTRGDRRIDVADHRLGPFDFLSTIGCRLSEVVAARNGPLGRVLVPARRWAYEREVLTAARDCLPSMSASRAARLQALVERKRAELPAHAWNAVWLDENVERFLGSGPAALIGGGDPDDGARQLRVAARALAEGDLAKLEAALAAVRDDPAAGPRLRDAARIAATLEDVAGRLRGVVPASCDGLARSLTRVFEERFVPLRGALVDLDAQVDAIASGVAALFEATPTVEPSDPMRDWRDAVVGDGVVPGVAARHRAALATHALAWGPVLRACADWPAPSAS